MAFLAYHFTYYTLTMKKGINSSLNIFVFIIFILISNIIACAKWLMSVNANGIDKMYKDMMYFNII